MRGVILQAFHWYLSADGQWWEQIAERANAFAQSGFTAIWLPPASKGAAGAQDVGYGVYDLYDLGEFNQKGSIATKYGTRPEFLAAIKKLQEVKLDVYVDIVLNHRLGGDELENITAVPYHNSNRLQPVGEPEQIRAYTRFRFAGRNNKYSDFQFCHEHFDATDYDANQPDRRDTIWLFSGKNFDSGTALERGNYDYLMGCDLDFESPTVQQELLRWGKWFIKTSSADGLRLDAIKHIPVWFFPQWLPEVERTAKKKLFVVGEYFSHDLNELLAYLEQAGDTISLFDIPLHGHCHRAGLERSNFDLRTILDGTLVQAKPQQAVTFVANHDSQALQALEAVVEPWFKPLAYAIILLRQEGYPCVFLADYDGAEYQGQGRDGKDYKIVMPSHHRWIELCLHLRQRYLHGQQSDYFDDKNCIGWVQRGEERHSQTMAVVLSNGGNATKRMNTGKSNAVYIDASGHILDSVKTDQEGWGEFACPAESVAIWIEKL